MKRVVNGKNFNNELSKFRESKKTMPEFLIFLGKSRNRLDLDENAQKLIKICIFMIDTAVCPCSENPFEIELLDYFVKLDGWQKRDEWIAFFSIMSPGYKFTNTEPLVF